MTPTLKHTPVCCVSDSKDMGWHLMTFLALVQLNDFFGVDWKFLVWVHHNTEKTRVGLKWQLSNALLTY